jgi:hypothetical protein
MSEPYDHSKDDRDENISFLLVQLCKDIAIAREACMIALNDLRGLTGIHVFMGSQQELKN